MDVLNLPISLKGDAVKVLRNRCQWKVESIMLETNFFRGEIKHGNFTLYDNESYSISFAFTEDNHVLEIIRPQNQQATLHILYKTDLTKKQVMDTLSPMLGIEYEENLPAGSRARDIELFLKALAKQSNRFTYNGELIALKGSHQTSLYVGIEEGGTFRFHSKWGQVTINDLDYVSDTSQINLLIRHFKEEFQKHKIRQYL